jgi:D-arginine dehydrogenase
MDADVLIVGGGVAGLSVAAFLAPDASVVLAEAEPAFGYHASGRSAALFEAAYGEPTAVALNRIAQGFHETIEGGVLSPRGLMLIVRADDRDDFEAERRAMGLDPLDRDAALALFPILDADAWPLAAWHAEAWDIDTDRLMQAFARMARRDGARLLTGAPVTAIARDGAGWRADTGQGPVRARLIVNAAGAWADRIAAMAGAAPIGLRPMRRSMARLPAPGGREVACWPFVLAAREAFYARPDAGKWIVSPAEEDPAEPHDAWADDMVLAEGLHRYEQAVTEPVTRVETSWAGLRSFTPDRQMAIGFAPDCPGFFWHAGQGGNGFQTAPAAGRLAADLVAGHAPQCGNALARALDPDRFL